MRILPLLLLSMAFTLAVLAADEAAAPVFATPPFDWVLTVDPMGPQPDPPKPVPVTRVVKTRLLTAKQVAWLCGTTDTAPDGFDPATRGVLKTWMPDALCEIVGPLTDEREFVVKADGGEDAVRQFEALLASVEQPVRTVRFDLRAFSVTRNGLRAMADEPAVLQSLDTWYVFTATATIANGESATLSPLPGVTVELRGLHVSPNAMPRFVDGIKVISGTTVSTLEGVSMKDGRMLLFGPVALPPGNKLQMPDDGMLLLELTPTVGQLADRDVVAHNVRSFLDYFAECKAYSDRR